MSPVSRRQVMQSAALAALATPLLPTASVEGATVKDPLARSRFQAQLGATFTLTVGGSSTKAVLTAVDDLAPTRVVGDERNYRLTFAASSAGPAQATMSVSRPGFSTTPLFLVPNSTRRSYGAIVARG